jgi:hypothetical protein
MKKRKPDAARHYENNQLRYIHNNNTEMVTKMTKEIIDQRCRTIVKPYVLTISGSFRKLI